jgi:hypothetical protein
MKALVILAAVLGFAQAAVSQNADDYRGGWKTDDTQGGEPHTYEFSIRGEQVRGIYCSYCSDATTLAFVDGKFDANGLSFVVTHVKADGSTAYQDHASAKFDRGNLIVNGTSGAPGGVKFQWTMSKDPRGPDPLPIPIVMLPAGRTIPVLPFPTGGPRPAPYVQPGPWIQQLSEANVVGVWLGFGVGIDKQFFIIRKVVNKLRGMVCGRCENTYTMAALDDFSIEGDTLKFNILHEDWGDYSIPFYKHVTAHIARNEMRFTTSQENLPKSMPPRPPGANFGSSLLGPIAAEATTGNH